MRIIINSIQSFNFDWKLLLKVLGPCPKMLHLRNHFFLFQLWFWRIFYMVFCQTLPFFENWKKCPDFEKKVSIALNVSLHILFQGVIRRKNSWCLPAGHFFRVLNEIFIQTLLLQENFHALKNSWFRTWHIHLPRSDSHSGTKKDLS